MRPTYIALFISIVLTAGTAEARQAVDSAEASTSGQIEAGPVTTAPIVNAPAAGQPSTGLTAMPNQPRTLRHYWHVFTAFAIVWLLLFGYTLSVARRFARLEDEVKGLRG